MCEKVPYPSRWLAKLVQHALQRKGLGVRSVHPCYSDHPGAWHVTSARTKW